MKYFSLFQKLVLVLQCFTTFHVVSSWEWNDLLSAPSLSSSSSSSSTNTLTMAQVSEMRVRDIKRRLARTHGYSAEELGAMLDKKELIRALSFEEYKVRKVEDDEHKRWVIIKTILYTFGAMVFYFFLPLFQQLYEVASVNFVVYTDRKRYELSRCMELQSTTAAIGIILMFVVDALQLWLSVSVLLSWVISKSKYFFPTPSLSVRPGQFMGNQVANGPLGQYGVNIGPMVITWLLRFLAARIEGWTGKQLSKAHAKQRKEAKQFESPEERAARKAAKKAAKRAAKEEALRQEQQKEQMRRKQAAEDATAKLFQKNPTTKSTTNNNEEKANDNNDVLSDDNNQQHYDFKENNDIKNNLDENQKRLEEKIEECMDDLD